MNPDFDLKEKGGTEYSWGGWWQYRWGLSSACADLFESPQTSSVRLEKDPGAQAEGRRTSLCQHPGKTQHVYAQKSHTDVKVNLTQRREGLCRSYGTLGARRWKRKPSEACACSSALQTSQQRYQSEAEADKVHWAGAERKWQLSLPQSQRHNELVTSARVFSCRLTLAQSSPPSSAHLENLIIYTSAPLDAVPI